MESKCAASKTSYVIKDAFNMFQVDVQEPVGAFEPVTNPRGQIMLYNLSSSALFLLTLLSSVVPTFAFEAGTEWMTIQPSHRDTPETVLITYPAKADGNAYAWCRRSVARRSRSPPRDAGFREVSSDHSLARFRGQCCVARMAFNRTRPQWLRRGSTKPPAFDIRRFYSGRKLQDLGASSGHLRACYPSCFFSA